MFSRDTSKREGIGEKAHTTFSRGSGSARGARMSSLGISQVLFLPQLVPVILLVCYGALIIWSASLTIPEASFPRQILGIVLGAIAAYAAWSYDYRTLANMSTALLVADVVLMLLPKVPGIGYSAMGMTGWIRIPIIGLRFQPSELAKLVTILLMASLGAQFNGRIETLLDYLKLCGILCIPFLLILTQPDLGTGLIVLVSGASIIICSGAPRSWVLITIGIVVLGATLVVVTSLMPGVPHVLKQYQLNRLIVFVDPSVDPTGDGYNLQQAKIAVGSGGFFGKGVGNATQSGSGFLPEAHTDFVFALMAEEFGFLGSTVLLALFGWLLFSTITLAQRVDSPFAKLILVGIVTMWSFQLLQNVGMCIGLMPITGIPLPFISFGSSSMISQLMCVGMCQSIWRHRPKAA